MSRRASSVDPGEARGLFGSDDENESMPAVDPLLGDMGQEADAPEHHDPPDDPEEEEGELEELTNCVPNALAPRIRRIHQNLGHPSHAIMKRFF